MWLVKCVSPWTSVGKDLIIPVSGWIHSSPFLWGIAWVPTLWIEEAWKFCTFTVYSLLTFLRASELQFSCEGFLGISFFSFYSFLDRSFEIVQNHLPSGNKNKSIGSPLPIFLYNSTILHTAIVFFTNIKPLFSNDATGKHYTSCKFCSNMNKGIAKFKVCSDSQVVLGDIRL